jgi:hypothetical protein
MTSGLSTPGAQLTSMTCFLLPWLQESVVAGLGMSDLDALISRLQAGGAPLDLAATR